jgi:hypothetical protein
MRTADDSRYCGTPDFQPPVSEDIQSTIRPDLIFAEEKNWHGKKEDDYEPGNWLITTKSDIWGVGLVAYELLYAGRGQTANKALSCFFSDATLNWVRTLSEETEPGDNEELIPQGDP